MLFSSALFLLYFFPVFITGVFVIPKTLQNAFLLILSLFFYFWGAPEFILILIYVTSINFFVAGKIPHHKRKRLLLWIYIALNLGLLAYFKYTNFLIENVNLLLLDLGLKRVELNNIVLPLGISFFTFQSITYGVDVYRGNAQPQKSIFNYWLYILFFPQLIAGPIVTYNSISEQLTKRVINQSKIIEGVCRFVIGLGKKVLIANVLSLYSDQLYHWNSLYPDSSPLIAWVALIAFTFEIYFDFSGYTDMAIGLGRIAGFEFPENFNKPYLAASVTDFWKRWHITLGKFMKNYLYIPLGGNRVKNSRLYVNLILVFFLSGLWHGASWNFIAWGIYFGFFLIIERLIKINKEGWKRPVFIIVNFIIILHGWVLFDANDLSEALSNLNKLYSFRSFHFYEEKDNLFFMAHLIFAILVTFTGLSEPKSISIKNMPFGRSVLRYGFILSVFILSLSHLIGGDHNPFIYFQF